MFQGSIPQAMRDMLYRGLFDLNNRQNTPETTYGYVLNDVAVAGQWTLAEGYGEWHKKYAEI